MAGRRPREDGPDDLLRTRRPGAIRPGERRGNNVPGSTGGHKLGPGNTAGKGRLPPNVTHGLGSERLLSQRAQAILTAMLSDVHCPDYLRTAAFLPSVMAWSRAEAAAAAAWEWCESLGAPAMFLMGEGHGRSAIDMWKGLSAHARSVRNDIGISPVSYARIARDLGIAQQATEDRLNAAAKEGRAITARRFGVVQGGADAPDAGHEAS